VFKFMLRNGAYLGDRDDVCISIVVHVFVQITCNCLM
jgi:hypothetical protein